VYVAAGSFRGNGILDLAVAESDTSTIGILLGNGDGTFGYENTFTLPEPPSALTINDFNHDGKLDVVAVMTTVVEPAMQAVPYLALLEGSGKGDFAAPIVTSNYGFYSTAMNLDSADVNMDGLSDLLITGPGLENSQIYLNNGDGTFNAGQTVIGNGLFNLELDGRLADINEDGCPDAVVGDINNQVWISLGDCAGNFAAPTTFATGDSNASVRLADLNGDGHLDVVAAAYPGLGENNGEAYGMTAGNTLNVAFGDGHGGFSISRNYVGTGQSYSVAIADFNGDGKPDLVTANSDTDTTSVYINDQAGAFGFPEGVYVGMPAVYVTNQPISSLSFSDLNNDGKPDLFFLEGGYNGEYFTTSLLNDGSGRFAAPINADTGISYVSNPIGDYRVSNFRGGGRQDLVAIGQSSAYSGSSPFVLFMPGNGDGSFGKPVVTATPNAGGSMATGDFNGDGKLDLVAVEGQGTMTLSTFPGNGDGTFRSGTSLNFTDQNSDILRVYTSDFNQDGKLDVLVFTTRNGYWTTTSAVWEFDGNGDGSFQPGRQLYTDFQPFALGDVNGDKLPDIARYDFFWPDGTTENYGPAKFTNYLGQADGTFPLTGSYAPYSGIPEEVQPYLQDGDPLASSLLGDFNGDGKLDEVAFQSQNSLLYSQMLVGNGDGTFDPAYDIYPTYLFGYPLYAHDLDGDGIADMVELDGGSSALHIIKGGPASALQISLDDEVVTNNASCGYVFPEVASASARTVSFASSIAEVQLPASVSLPANATYVKFCYTLASSFDATRVFDVNATLDGGTATAYASSSYTIDFSETISPSSIPAFYAGESSTPITVALTATAGFNGSVALSCDGLPDGASCQFSSSSVNVSAASVATTTVTVVTTADVGYNGDQITFNIVASDPNVIQRQPVNLNVATLFAAPSTSSYLVIGPGSISGPVTISGIPPYNLSCSGLPAWATCSFSGDQLPYPSESDITATLQLANGVTAGSYPFTIDVTSGPQVTSQSNLLSVIDFTLQQPPASGDWALPGVTYQTIGIPATAIGGSLYVTVTCSLDSGGSCSGGALLASANTANLQVQVTIPADMPTGLHQLTVVGTYQNQAAQISLTHSYTFPFYVADLSGSLSSSTISMAEGASSNVMLTLNATAGFLDTVPLACSGPVQITCSFSQLAPQLAGGTPVPITLTLAASTTASNRRQEYPLAHPFDQSMAAFAALFPLALIFRSRRGRRPPLLLMFLGLVMLLPLTSCGSGGKAVATGGTGGGSTPNVYTINVVAAPAGTFTTRTLGTITVSVN
jgi:expansin (peptidoglycan-binding protein)